MAQDHWHSNVILTAVVATSIFATLQSTTTNKPLAITTGIVAVAAAILAALQAFLDLADKAEKHKSAGGRYATLRRRIDIFRLKYENAEDDAKRAESLELLEEFATDLGSLDAECPSLSEAMFKKGKRDFDSSAWPETDDQV